MYRVGPTVVVRIFTSCPVVPCSIFFSWGRVPIPLKSTHQKRTALPLADGLIFGFGRDVGSKTNLVRGGRYRTVRVRFFLWCVSLREHARKHVANIARVSPRVSTKPAIDQNPDKGHSEVFPEACFQKRLVSPTLERAARQAERC